MINLFFSLEKSCYFITLHCRQTLTSQYSCHEDCPSMCLLARRLIDWLAVGGIQGDKLTC